MKNIKTYEAYINAEEFFHGDDKENEIDYQNMIQFPDKIEDVDNPQMSHHIVKIKFDDIKFDKRKKFNYEGEFKNFLNQNSKCILLKSESVPNYTGSPLYIAYSPVTRKSAFVFDGCTFIVKTLFNNAEECVKILSTGINGEDYETEE